MGIPADNVREVLKHKEPVSSATPIGEEEDSHLAGLMLAEFRRVAGKEPTEPALTAQEKEVLMLVAKGQSYREVAQRLLISVTTVQGHVQNVIRKLPVRSRYELMRYAIQKGLDRGPDREA